VTLARRQIGWRVGRIRVAPLLAATVLAISFAGCGGDGEAQSSVPVPEDCLSSWNSETTAQEFGRHVYNTHDTRQAQVALLEPAEGAFNISGSEACAVIFAVPESDFEYGDVGLVVTRLGWASMQELARGDQVALEEIQREATAAPNATLFPDGSLEPN
jgi:hypothetical protein